LSRIIDGLSGANISTAQAIITDSTNEKTRTQGLGLLGAAFGLGFVIGPVIAFVTLAIGGNDYRVPAFVAAGFSALSIFLSWRFLEETHGPEKRGSDKTQAAFSLGAMFKALGYPGIGILLALMFAQQVAFGGFEQILAIFTLNRLGLNAAGNSIVFVFVGIIVVAVQGYYIGKWSRRFGERKLIYLGLVTLTIGLALIAFTPAQPAPWYNRAAIEKELSSRTLPGETPPTQDIAIPLPPADGGTGVLGLGWLMLAMVPVAIGGGVMQPSINSLLTKRVTADERGGILGISTAFLSAANALAPVIGGVLFQLGGGSLPFIAWAVLLGLLLGAAWMLIKPDTEERPARGLSPSAA
jgi:DHA1 family tetracycline resistance protein-like MFS transporter